MNRRILARTGFLTLSAIAALWATAHPAMAEDVTFPSTITIIVPYPPASSNDTFARLLADKLGPALGKTAIVENKPGASGDAGAYFVSKAKPDGSWLLVTSSSLTTNAAVEKNLPFDPLKDLIPVAQIAVGPAVVTVGSMKPYKTIQDLIEAAKKGGVTYGSSGVGSLSHLSMALFNSMAKTEMTHIPYKGIGESITDLMGGRIDITVSSISSIVSGLKAGSLRGLAVTSLEPSPLMPGLPTVASVLPGYQATIWWGLFAPHGMSPAMVEKLNEATRKIVDDAAMRDAFSKQGAGPGKQSVAEFTQQYRGDIEQWRKVAKDNNIQPE